MKTWTRCRAALLCGLCGEAQAAGVPIVIVTSDMGAPWKLVRCQTCARATPPPDLAELEPLAAVVHPSIPKRMPLFTAMRDMAEDWNTKQAGERE